MMFYYLNIDLANNNVYTVPTLVKFCLFILKIWSKNQILTPIKGRNSFENLQKMTLHNPNVDLVNGNVYTKFGLHLSFRSLTRY